MTKTVHVVSFQGKFEEFGDGHDARMFCLHLKMDCIEFVYRIYGKEFWESLKKR